MFVTVPYVNWPFSHGGREEAGETFEALEAAAPALVPGILATSAAAAVPSRGESNVSRVFVVAADATAGQEVPVVGPAAVLQVGCFDLIHIVHLR